MADSGFYERLTAQDSSYFAFEGSDQHAHVTAVALLEAGPLLGRNGGLDMERVRAYVESRIALLPRYRRRLAFTPVQRQPIWVDDDRFDIRYHVRHTGLPQPGLPEQLKEFSGAIASQRLDRSHPLWELWFVEGLTGDRFAIVAKVHHSMVDGVSGIDLLQVILSASTETEFAPAPPWKARPAPGTLDFAADGASDGLRMGVSAVRSLSDAVLSPRRTADAVLRAAASGWRTVQLGVPAPPNSPINGRISAQRRVDWQTLGLDEVRDLKKRLDGSVNDVVLAVVTGATRTFLKQRRARLRGSDLRVVVPVDTRANASDRELANRVSAWFVTLPVSERDPLKRFQRIRRQTRDHKELHAEEAIDRLYRLADWSGSTWTTAAVVQLIRALRPYNMIVSNIHGPPTPIYMLGARLLEFYPQLPLFANQGLAIAAMSYADKIGIGMMGDWDLLHDLPSYGRGLRHAFDELRTAAEGRD